ncbi:MAG: hypothetical protein ACJAYU_001228 [Bradymonadia bacterium]|jgi:hypothetical protein
MRTSTLLILLAGFLLLPACAEDDAIAIGAIPAQTTFVGEFLRVPFTVENPGTPLYDLTWSGPILPFLDRWTTVVNRPGGGEFLFEPTVDHIGVHRFTVNVAADERRASEQFTVEVAAAREAAPVFVEPGAGQAFDVSENPCIAVPIEARDRDTEEPEMTVVFGLPDGAEFEDEGRGLATFRWCPTPGQIAAASLYLVTFSADDGEHDPVLQDFRILLIGPDKEQCGGTPPLVEFLSPDENEAIISRVGYDVVIRVSDDNPLRDRPILFYTDGRLEQRDQIDLQGLRFATFRPAPERGEDVWTAFIPTFRLADDEAKTIALVPFVRDDDDPTGTRCDNTAELGIRRFTAVGAVEAGILSLCERCIVSGDCISGACLRTAFGGRCVPSCSNDDSNCGAGVCEQWNSMEGVVRFGCGSAEFVCNGLGLCAADSFEPNDTPDLATPLAATARSAVLCERDDDWFSVPRSGPVRITTTSDDPNIPIESELFGGDGQVISTGTVTGPGVREISACATEGSVVRVFAPTIERTGFSIAYEPADGDCNCTDDSGEPDTQQAPRTLLGTTQGTICGSNADFFAVAGEPGFRTAISLSFEGDADVDMDLITSDGELVAASRGVGPDEWLEVDLTEDDPYVLRVFAFDQRDADYELAVTRSELSVCATSTDCELDESCAGGLCTRLLCQRNADCPIGSICPLVDTIDTQRTCLETCESEQNCRAGEICKSFFEGAACFSAGEGLTGSQCEGATDCAGRRMCVDWPDGHCAIGGCDRVGACDGDGSCAVVDGRPICVETCWVSDDECSRTEGFSCRELFAPNNELVYGCSPDTR